MDVGCPLSINHSAIDTWLRWQRPEGNRWARRERDSRAKRLKVVTITEQPRLTPAVAEWLLDEFRHALSPSYDEQLAKLIAQEAPEETFVLFDDDVPVGTASLVTNDLPSRPDLTPWLASVLVRPQFRGRGYSSAPLIKHVERAAAASTAVLWLYTWSAEPVYARLGWERVGLERDTDRNIEVVLMRRNLS
jgi:GNAT superfamily N-acetyltransferase